ncbi:hypothetical protein WHI96_12140 [Pseudonocardia tropica]|uniref:Uncharacterized protein n=1 Tax=Pseudonocardia tropica TaxID=681289 RepID=A0ABV1JUE0_9PSEU
MRCPVLENGHADPLHDRPADEPTAREVDSWRAAWAHLAALGYRVDVPARVVAAGRGCSCGAAR